MKIKVFSDRDIFYRNFIVLDKYNKSFVNNYYILKSFFYNNNLVYDNNLKIIKFFIYSDLIDDKDIKYINTYYRIYKVMFNNFNVDNIINIPKAKFFDFSNLFFDTIDFENVIDYNVKLIDFSSSYGKYVKNLPKKVVK